VPICESSGFWPELQDRSPTRQNRALAGVVATFRRRWALSKRKVIVGFIESRSELRHELHDLSRIPEEDFQFVSIRETRVKVLRNVSKRFNEIFHLPTASQCAFLVLRPGKRGEVGAFGNFKKVEEKPLTGYRVFPYSVFSVGGPVKTK
jgi:hypothetical protein